MERQQRRLEVYLKEKVVEITHMIGFRFTTATKVMM
jgi:hypothetical protein